MADLSSQQLDDLRIFIRKKDREYPPVFVGRKTALRSIRDQAERTRDQILNADEHAAKGTTQILQGAPGAGKSATLTHLQKTWAKTARDVQTKPPQLLCVTASDFCSAEQFSRRLAGFLVEGGGLELDKKKMDETQTGISFGEWLVKIGFSVKHIEEYERDVKDDPIAAVIGLFPCKMWDCTVVIGIDEAQNLGGSRKDVPFPVHAMMLDKLHNGQYETPIMAVCAGLCDTRDRLVKLGLSQRSLHTGNSIGCMDEADCRQLIAGWDEKFGFPQNMEWKMHIKKMAEDADYWPTHIHAAMISLAEGLMETNGDFDRVDYDRVAQRASFWRKEYYHERMSSELKKSEYLLSSVMKMIPSRADKRSAVKIRDIVDTIEEVVSDPPSTSSGWKLPKNINGSEDYADHLLHQGFIQERSDGSFYCPIPSLKSHILEHHSPSGDHVVNPSRENG